MQTFRHAVLAAAFLTMLSFMARPALAGADGAYAKPDPARAFAALKIYDSHGSPLRMPVEDWAGASKRVASDPAWGAWAAKQRSSMDDWMQKRHDHIEWICGWYHDFVSPKDGSHLAFTPDEPTEYSLHSGSDPRVKLTPKLHAAWVDEFRSLMAGEIVTAAKLYRLTGDRKYADWAGGQIDFYADNYTKWPKQSNAPGTHFMWQSLDEATNLVDYATAARILGDYVTPERKARWFTELFLPECDLLNSTYHAVHNIACWHRAAVGIVAVLYHNNALWKKAVDDKYGVNDQLANGVTSDYLWREQSLGYNSYVVEALTPFFIAACEAGDAKKLTRQMEIAENLLLAPIAMRFPTGQLPNPADSGAPGHAPNTGQLADYARLFPTALGLSAAATRLDWDTLVDPLPTLKSAPALPPVVSQNLESTREAIIKEGPWQVFFHYGQLTAAHHEAEALNYEAFYESTDVTHDPGTVGYGSPMYRGFYATALPHNVPLVDGEGQVGWDPGKLIAYAAKTGHVEASQPKYRPNAAADRRLTINGDSLTDEVTVHTTDSNPHTLGLLVQTQGKAALPASFAPDSGLTAPGMPDGFKYFTDVTSAQFTDTAQFVLTYADGLTLHVRFSVPGSFTVFHASTPDYPPKRREVFLIRLAGKQSAVFRVEYKK